LVRYIGGYSRYGSPRGGRAIFGRSRLRSGEDWAEIWLKTKTAPDKVEEPPAGPMFVSFPSGAQIRPNDTVTTGLVRRENGARICKCQKIFEEGKTRSK